MLEILNTAQDRYKKVQSIILSCKTKEQLKVAYNLYNNFYKHYVHVLGKKSYFEYLSYFDGILMGLLIGIKENLD